MKKSGVNFIFLTDIQVKLRRSVNLVWPQPQPKDIIECLKYFFPAAVNVVHIVLQARPYVCGVSQKKRKSFE